MTTHHALKRNTISISPLSSKKYGGDNAVAVDQTTLRLDPVTGQLVNIEETVVLQRWSPTIRAVNGVFDSFVEGGLFAIDPTKCPQAGQCGKLESGVQVMFSMQTCMAARSAYLHLADTLTSKQLTSHFEDKFIPALAADMAGGHSLDSAVCKHLSHSAWLTSGESALTMVGRAAALITTATTASAAVVAVPKQVAFAENSTETAYKSKFDKMKLHYEKTLSEVKASKDKAVNELRRGRANQGYGNHGSRDDYNNRDRTSRRDN